MRQELEHALFAPLSSRAAAYLRIAFGLTLPFFFYSEGARQALFKKQASIVWLYENVLLTQGYWYLIVALSALLCLGWRARQIASALFVVLLPLMFLNFGHASRQVLLVALLGFSFVRSDATLAIRSTESDNAGPIWPVRIMQLQLTFLYLVNAIAKSSPGYLSGDILMAMSMGRDNVIANLSSGYFEIGPISIPVAIAATTSTLIEYSLAFGLWFRRTRWVTAVLGISFHALLTQMIMIHQLDLAAIFLYLPFLLKLTTVEYGSLRIQRA